MSNSTAIAKPAAILLLTASALWTSGCAVMTTAPGFANGSEDTVEICETRGTDTQCFRQRASAFVEQAEISREMLEMRDENYD